QLDPGSAWLWLSLAFVGFAGGFVSVTATIGSLGTTAAHDRQLTRGAVAGATLASVATPWEAASNMPLSRGAPSASKQHFSLRSHCS
ncbi:MAG TPA: hypothetical protein VGU64_15870, partial [Terriglobales bacterium]|nr:hypothetical protein [Terriglobales bacterium]